MAPYRDRNQGNSENNFDLPSVAACTDSCYYIRI